MMMMMGDGDGDGRTCCKGLIRGTGGGRMASNGDPSRGPRERERDVSEPSHSWWTYLG